MKIKLIYPDRYAKFRKFQFTFYRTPPLNLLTLAGLTPKDVDIEIIDERYKKIDFDDDVDIVAITVLTTNAVRAYEIADEFRRRGKHVVLGGVHPTFMYDEAKEHADTIVFGEAENIWGKLINDFKKGKIKKTYYDPNPDLSKVPLPRWDLLPNRNRYVTFIQSSRGCPNNCSFCSVTKFSGRMVRTRPIKDIIREIKSLGPRMKKFIIFVDDNILGNMKHALKLFKALTPLKIKWGSEASINLLRNLDMVKTAAKSGCRALFIGFESISEKALEQVNKAFNRVKEYKKLVDTLHKHKIAVIASLMFGFDTDDKNVFKETVNFLDDMKVDAAIFSILTPLPGTEIYNQYKKQGRIFEKDWSKFDALHTTFYQKNISPKELEQGLDTAFREFYKPARVLKRIIRVARIAPFMIPVNLGFMLGVRKGLVPDRNRWEN